MSAHAAGSEEQWDQALNEAWQLLSPAQRQELKQDEHEWVQWKQKLPDEARYNAIENREMYLRAILDGKHPDAVQGWNVRINFDRPTGKISPAEAQQLLDREEQQRQRENQQTTNLRAQLEASDPHKLVQKDYEMGYRYYQSSLDETVGYHAGDPITVSEIAIPGLIDEAIVKFKGKITSLSSFEKGFRQAIADYAHGGPKRLTPEVAPIPTPTPKAVAPEKVSAYDLGYKVGLEIATRFPQGVNASQMGSLVVPIQNQYNPQHDEDWDSAFGSGIGQALRDKGIQIFAE
jgi:hypothetical protein